MARTRNVRAKLSVSRDHRWDRISDLPDDLLLQILVLLPIVEAVRTCVLSTRWRHVWRRLPRLEFNDDEDAPAVPSFADLVGGVIIGYATDVTMPNVSISVSYQYEFSEAIRVAVLAFLAAQRVTTTFDLFMSQEEEEEEEDDEEQEIVQEPPLFMPCFPWVKELAITFSGVNLWMPYIGTFFNLTKLYIFGVRFSDDGWGLQDVVSWHRCPSLQDLELNMIKGLKKLIIFSPSLLRLRLFRIMHLERLLVLACNLRHMHVTKSFVHMHARERTLLLLSVPKLEHFQWEDRCPSEIHSWSLPSQLLKLTITELPLAYLINCDGGQSRFTKILQIFEHINTLSLELPVEPENAELNDLIENADISYFRELDLTVKRNEHTFAPTILSLLSRHKWMRKLSLQIIDDREVDDISPPCTSSCYCRNIQNWRDNKITLDYLNWLVMSSFSGTEDETFFLFSVVKNAKALRKVSILFSMGVEPTEKFVQTLRKQSQSGCTIEYSLTF